jgi:hypothetical protein
VAAYIALSRWGRGSWRPRVLEGLVAETKEESFGDLSGLAVEIDHCGGHAYVVRTCRLGL